MRLWGINTANSVVIPQSLVLRSLQHCFRLNLNNYIEIGRYFLSMFHPYTHDLKCFPFYEARDIIKISLTSIS